MAALTGRVAISCQPAHRLCQQRRLQLHQPGLQQAAHSRRRRLPALLQLARGRCLHAGCPLLPAAAAFGRRQQRGAALLDLRHLPGRRLHGSALRGAKQGRQACGTGGLAPFGSSLGRIEKLDLRWERREVEEGLRRGEGVLVKFRKRVAMVDE